MLVSRNWLREWVAVDVPVQELADSLSLAGLEVAGVEEYAPLSSKIVVGRVVGVEAHPRSSKLKLCVVDAGRKRPLKIVCGAPNVRRGILTAVALIGAELPRGRKIAKTRVRDIVSSGMLCSTAELGLDDDAAGVVELDASARPGTTLNEHLDLADQVLDVELTPNRGDCLCISGVATEVAVLHGAALKGPRLKPVKALSRRRVPIDIEAPGDCPRYAGRVIEDVDLAARAPDWIRERLRKSGLRSISLAVDVTNYVMLELGQPLHAFDLDKLERGIVVRHARAGESLELLDGHRIEIPSGTLLIADHARAVALAGIMGGADTAISATTTNVLLESAYFRAGALRSRALGLKTDASHRFERHVDPESQVAALHRATELLTAAGGGRPGPILNACSRRHLPARKPITLRRRRIATLLGTDVPARQVERILKRLRMKVRAQQHGWRVTAPSNRRDIQGEHDLIEEVARIFGYDKIVEHAPNATPAGGLTREARLPERRFKTFLVDRDYHEAICYSFVDPVLQALLDPRRPPIALENPIASDMAVLRTSLWPGLLTALGRNYRRQRRRIRLFETGHVFHGGKSGHREKHLVAAVCTGPPFPTHWSEHARDADFFDVKGDVEGLLALSGRGGAYRFAADRHPALHPGQAARVSRGGDAVGWVGALHPSIRRKLDIEQPVYLFELELERLSESRVPRFESVSRFPSTGRDLSIVVAEDVPAHEVERVIRAAGGKRLVELELFDLYRGPGVPGGHKSLSYALTLQDSLRNLTDTEIEETMERVLSAVRGRLNGNLRT